MSSPLRRPCSLLVPLSLALLLPACSSSHDGTSAPSDARSASSTSDAPASHTTLTGTLQHHLPGNDANANTYTLVGERSSGGVEVDVSNVAAAARALDGNRVTVSGRLTPGSSDTKPRLVADHIAAAPAPAADR